MFQINSIARSQKNSQNRFGKRLIGFQNDTIFFPLRRIDDQFLRGKGLLFVIGRNINQLYPDFCIFRIIHRSRPDRKTVFFILFDANSEISFVIQSRMFMRMTRIFESYVMRILFKRPIVADRYLAKRLPPHETVGKFKRAIFHQLGI